MERVVFSRKISSRADREILRLHHNIQLHDKLAALQNEKNELQDSLNALQDSLNVLHNEKNVLSNELATVTDIKNALQAERDLLRSTLDGVYASRSWWLTKPLRAAARLARRLHNAKSLLALQQSPETIEPLPSATLKLQEDASTNELPQTSVIARPLQPATPALSDPEQTPVEQNIKTTLQRKDTPDIWIDNSRVFFPQWYYVFVSTNGAISAVFRNLRLEEFAEEPIGTGGTLAHAMERLPALIAARNGYMVRSFTPVDAV